MLRRNSLILTLGVALVVLGGALLLGSTDEPMADGKLIFTAIPVEPTEPGSKAIDWRYPERSRIMALDLHHPERPPVVLTEGFQAARAPEISFDGQRILFAGQKEAGDTWQIWEMRLDGSGLRQVTDGGGTDPTYLPHDKVLFSLRLTEGEDRHVLATANRDGTEAQQITFHPDSDGAPTVLQDGRVIVPHRTLEEGTTALLGMRYDGTKAELFYRNTRGSRLNSKAWETDNRRLVFVESMVGDAVGGDLVAVSETRPLHSRMDLAPDVPGLFHSVFPDTSGQYPVSYRADATAPFALHLFSLTDQHIVQRLHGDAAYHAVEPVLAVGRAEPMGFVSIVDEQKEAGWLYCLDADHSTLPLADAAARGARVRVQSVEGLLGEVPLHADGSFYIEVPPDTPLQFQTLDAEGRALRGPSAWIWVRPNEQRGCVGCHEDREFVPENRVPQAITQPPVSLLPPSAVASNHPQNLQPAHGAPPEDEKP